MTLRIGLAVLFVSIVYFLVIKHMVKSRISKVHALNNPYWRFRSNAYYRKNITKPYKSDDDDTHEAEMQIYSF